MKKKNPTVEVLEEIFDSRYRRLEKLGEGTYGTVFKCQDMQNGNRLVALKKIRLDNEEEGVPSTAIREISILKALHGHPSIVDLIDVQCHPKRLHLVFEYLPYDLKKYLSAKKVLPMAQIKLFVHQLLDALAFCASLRIIHRDLKPQNLLVDADGTVLKLADFGLARAFQLPLHTYTHEVVTLWYRSPEILMGTKHYAPDVDIWSVGTIMAELATRRPIFAGDSEIDQLFKIFRVLGTPSEDDWPGVTALKDFCPVFPHWESQPLPQVCPQLDANGIDLLGKMLVFDPAKRISAKAALTHPWFDDLPRVANA